MLHSRHAHVFPTIIQMNIPQKIEAFHHHFITQTHLEKPASTQSI
ncbi:MAG: hypothetical protein WBA57_20525 [Elainellaceae cyanobacterium]